MVPPATTAPPMARYFFESESIGYDRLIIKVN